MSLTKLFIGLVLRYQDAHLLQHSLNLPEILRHPQIRPAGSLALKVVKLVDIDDNIKRIIGKLQFPLFQVLLFVWQADSEANDVTEAIIDHVLRQLLTLVLTYFQDQDTHVALTISIVFGDQRILAPSLNGLMSLAVAVDAAREAQLHQILILLVVIGAKKFFNLLFDSLPIG